MKTKISSKMTWWLRKGRPFNVNDEYEIELIKIDEKTNTVQVLVRNIKTGEDNAQEK